MPVVNPLVRELVFKVVYYGPGLGGKTTSLQHVHANTKPEHRGKMVSLATPVDRTLYFDFLPIRVPHVRGMGVRLQLFTVPGQVYYNATRKLVLTGVDGIVSVFDSQRERMDANVESLENLRENLRAHGKALEHVPHVIQYNKRDIADALRIEELDAQLNHHHVPTFPTTATTGEGVYEALEAITRAVLADFERRVPESKSLDTVTTLELPEGGLADALRRADGQQPPRHEILSTTDASGVFDLSQPPEVDPGEALARAIAGDTARPPPEQPTAAPLAAPPAPAMPTNLELPPPLESRRVTQAAPTAELNHAPRAVPPAPALSFDMLWPAAERGTVLELERALALGDYSRALACTDRLVARTLASAGALLGGSAEAPRDPGTVALLLGLDGPRYLEHRALVRDSRAGKSISAVDALRAYATAIEVRLLRARVGA